MNNKKYWFFGSKLNTFLLVVLIVLMVIALKYMSRDKKTYMPYVDQTAPQTVTQKPVEVKEKNQGNTEDLVAFSLRPGQEVSGKMIVTGTLKGGYFFEGNLPISILDANKNPTQYGPGHANATTEWGTIGPVSFSQEFDFSVMPKGKYYIKLTQDDPSGGESGRPIRFVMIPIIVK